MRRTGQYVNRASDWYRLKQVGKVVNGQQTAQQAACAHDRTHAKRSPPVAASQTEIAACQKDAADDDEQIRKEDDASRDARRIWRGWQLDPLRPRPRCDDVEVDGLAGCGRGLHADVQIWPIGIGAGPRARARRSATAAPTVAVPKRTDRSVTRRA